MHRLVWLQHLRGMVYAWRGKVLLLSYIKNRLYNASYSGTIVWMSNRFA